MFEVIYPADLLQYILCVKFPLKAAQEAVHINNGFFIETVSFCIAHLHVPYGHVEISRIPVQMIYDFFCNGSILVIKGKVSYQVGEKMVIPCIPVLLLDILKNLF